MDFTKLKAMGSDLVDKAGDIAGQAKEKAGPLAAQAKEKAGPLAEKAKDAAAKGVDKAADGIDSATHGKYKDKIDSVSGKLGTDRGTDVPAAATFPAATSPAAATSPDAPTIVEVGAVTDADPASPWPAATAADLPESTVLGNTTPTPGA